MLFRSFQFNEADLNSLFASAFCRRGFDSQLQASEIKFHFSNSCFLIAFECRKYVASFTITKFRFRCEKHKFSTCPGSNAVLGSIRSNSHFRVALNSGLASCSALFFSDTYTGACICMTFSLVCDSGRKHGMRKI